MSTYTLPAKVAIVTGAGSGIGHALARLLLDSGCYVVFADLQLRPEAQETLSEHAAAALFHATDVADWAQLTSLWAATMARFQRVDIVASVAGIYEPPWSAFWRAPGVAPEACDQPDAAVGQYRTVAVNQVAPIRLAQMAMDYWTQHRDVQGSFVAVASIAAYLHSLETPLYMATKAALVSFVKSLGPVRDLLGIRMAVVCPGPVFTPIFEPEWNKKLGDEDIALTSDECAAVILRVLQEPQWGNGSVVETQKVGTKEDAQLLARDVQLELLYPTTFVKPSERVIQSSLNLAKRIQEHGMRS